MILLSKFFLFFFLNIVNFRFYEGQRLLPIVRDLGFDSMTDFLKVCGFKVDGAWVSTVSGGVVDSGVDNVISLMQRTVPRPKSHDSFNSLMSFRTQAKKYLSSIVQHPNNLTPKEVASNNNFSCNNINSSRKLKDTPASANSIFGKKHVDRSKSTNPFIRPLPHLTRGSILSEFLFRCPFIIMTFRS